MKDLLERLGYIQNELKAPKNQHNSYGNYNYRSCEDILEAVKPLLDKYDLVMRLEDELINIGDRYYIKATEFLYGEGACLTNVACAREEETKKGMDGSQITGASSSYARKYALNGLFLIDDNKDSDYTNQGEEITEESAKAYTFTFGKYKGKSISEVYNDDPKYLTWCLDKNDNEPLKQMIELITDMKRTPVPDTEEEQIKKLELLNELNKMVALTGFSLDRVKRSYDVKSTGDMTIEQLEDAIERLNKVGVDNVN